MGISCSSVQAKPSICSPSQSLFSKKQLIIYFSKAEVKDELFDFKASNVSFEKKTTIIPDKIPIDLDLKATAESLEKESEIFPLKITKNRMNKFTVYSIELSNNYVKDDMKKETLWRVVRKGNHKVELKGDTVLRMGEISLCLRKIHIPGEKPLGLFKLMNPEAEKQSKNNVCRICLGTATSLNNPLISPCKCSGKEKYVHFNCLKSWVMEKIECSDDRFLLIYTWEKLICDFCNSDLTLNYRIGGKCVHLLQNNDDNRCFIVFEVNFPQKEKKNRFYVCSFEEGRPITFGRDFDCQIRMDSFTVSRFHARMVLESGKILLEDLDSKFGTLVLVQKSFTFSQNDLIGMRFLFGNRLVKMALV